MSDVTTSKGKSLKELAVQLIPLKKPARTAENAVRGILGLLGVAVIFYGCLRMFQQQRAAVPELAKWLIGSVIVHDGIIAPLTIVIGWLIARYVPTHAKAYVQGFLITSALVCSVAFILIRRQHKYSAKSLALLRQNYVLNTAILVAIILAATLAAYALSRLRANRTKSLPPADH